MLRRRPRRYGLAALVTVAVLLVTVAVALAHHGIDNIFPSPNYRNGAPCAIGELCLTDDAILTVHKRNSLTAADKQEIQFALNEWFEPTDLNVVKVDPPNLSGGDETDIIYTFDPSGVPSGAKGVAKCDEIASYWVCDQHFIYWAVRPAKNNACHETGHAVGLLHGPNSSPPVAHDHRAAVYEESERTYVILGRT